MKVCLLISLQYHDSGDLAKGVDLHCRITTPTEFEGEATLDLSLKKRNEMLLVAIETYSVQQTSPPSLRACLCQPQAMAVGGGAGTALCTALRSLTQPQSVFVQVSSPLCVCIY